MAKAIVAKVSQTIDIPGADKIHVAVVLGENCIVSKDVGVGYVGVLFPADTQLSEEYCKENNLFRRSELNKDTTKAGFFEENRRVRVQPFLKVKSQAYFASLDSLAYADLKIYDYSVGATFDELNGRKICDKYISIATREALEKQNRPKAKKVSETPYFEKHVDSAQFKHNAALIPVGAMLSFTAKVHGTSHRSSFTKVIHTLPKWKQLINKVVPLFPVEEWKHVVGTRNVVLTEGKEGFHGSEQFRFDVMESLKPHMEKGLSIYGEIAGYANGKPIMAVHSTKSTKDKAFQKKYGESIVYKYNCAEHENYFFIYRITYLTQEGHNIDMTPAQIKMWCEQHGFNAPLEVAEPYFYDGDLEKLLAKVEELTERPDVLGADYIDPSHPGEGIIVRVDTGKTNPYFLKSKAYYFRVLEGLCESLDTEDLEAISE
jgi:hypothetical protein